MDRNHAMPRLCFILTAALTLAGVILRTVCLLCCFDANPGYFSEGVLPMLSNLLYVAAVIAAVAGAALIPKSILPTELHIPMRAFVAILLGVSLAAFTVISLLICFPARRNDVMIIPSLLGLLASTYYFVSWNRDGRYPNWLSFLGYLPALWSISAVGDTYFDNYVTMNSPVKIALQMGFLGFALMCLSELRFRVGRSAPRYSIAFLSIGAFTCLVGSIPVLIATCAGVLDHFRHLLYATVLLCAGLYGLYLLFRYTCLPPAEGSSLEPAADTAQTDE